MAVNLVALAALCFAIACCFGSVRKKIMRVVDVENETIAQLHWRRELMSTLRFMVQQWQVFWASSTIRQQLRLSPVCGLCVGFGWHASMPTSSMKKRNVRRVSTGASWRA